MDYSLNTVDAVVVGGGIMGCATAYYLTQAGINNVALLERDVLVSGSTGRCAGGFRQQFPTIPECQLAKESVDMIKALNDELDKDFEYNEGGYLVLSYTEDHAKNAKEKIAMQNKLGIDVRWLETNEIADVAPWLNIDEGFIGAAFCPTDGLLNPFSFTYAYAEAFQKNGGSIFQHTNVTGIEINNYSNYVVKTSQGNFHTDLLFNCTGAYSGAFGDMLGHKIPVIPLAREKIVTEPVKFFQPFLCNSPLHTLHFSQTKNGNFLMSCADLSIKQRKDLKNTWRFTQQTANSVRRLVPALGKVKILRQWSGFYETTADGEPFIGGIDGLEGFAQAVGFNGHGMMLAPGACKAIVDYALGDDVPEWFDTFEMKRIYNAAQV
ncbi:MAG TPA: FAD-binding oxidoreductase [Thermoclostridium sp.]|nr:FAD-binding oxidoreductase [Thermoclostridium sp.]